MKKIKMYCICIHNKYYNAVKNLGYVPVGLGKDNFSEGWLRDNKGENISEKNEFYGEYSFHYWFWKNMLPKIDGNQWVGFCAYRNYWSNKKKIVNDLNFKINKEGIPNLIVSNNTKLENVVLKEIPREWENFDTVIGNHIFINNLKLSKLLKHGLWSLIRNPSALIKSKRNIRFHFDMWHGNGSLDKAIDLLNDNDREDFRKYTRENISFSTGNMFVCRSKKLLIIIMNLYFRGFEDVKKFLVLI